MDLVLMIFWFLAALILASAWAVVNGNDIVHSVVWLATVFLLTACLFIIADAEFLAVIQVLVYVGAISVVIIFGIMLTKRTLKGGEDV
ncbi:MAG: NADH-quinone oxidoreductase subunit J [Candidatus Poseidoniia archaeon]|jgi:NADH-quinone oxidoreductase subunit J|nr:NADH-quinone oxidoreductase subunit J [Candidatus Poseidoniia archaeon]